MKMEMKKPQFMLESDKSKRYGLKWILELLVFYAVFSAGAVIETLILIVPMTYWMVNEMSDFMSADISSFAIEDFLSRITALMNSMPDWLMLLQLFATVGTILGVLIYCKKIEKRPLRTLGFVKSGAVPQYLLGLLVGLVMFSATILISALTGALKVNGLNPAANVGILVLFFLGFMLQGASEEMLCRGYFMTSFSKRYPLWTGILVNSLIFAALHLANPNVTLISVINLILCGVFFSLYAVKSGNLWGACAAHSMWNFAQGCIFGVNVSGMNCGDSLLTSSQVGASSLINGGAFGIEGGLACTIVHIIAIAVLLLMKGKNSKATCVADV